ncbi:hypothetical protein AGABI2DRAFT_116781 [Agaricus bisporus var. bisporus H97]|uniref:hypothetical protein n=1 Tax=Agaricus bisporus var. bisporus (strain H97 / ATCC MYA-4626 / FGSC 10389) TaxID=936046 RepID=UPI00029F74FB|nr:hypothetical protein AGABI2DRAFT_116781 [Agaricus bisporus var. bisporus H97]EKV47970.1 hypothetical protein AGABI2DRAFT_116781 [Agaricus bisporus var. bisporus H97]
MSNDTLFLTSTLQTFKNAVLAKTPLSTTHQLFKPDDSNEEWTARYEVWYALKTCLLIKTCSRPRNNNARMYMKQGMGLTGLGLKDFNQRVFEAFPAIHCSTQVFTHRKHANGQKDIPFTSAENPYNVLQNIKGNDFIHGEDNCVEYRKALIEQGHIIRVTLGGPCSIGIGDVVEVELSFRWFMDCTKQALFWLGCQSVTLIDNLTRRDKLKKEKTSPQQMIKSHMKHWLALTNLQDEEAPKDDKRLRVEDKGGMDVRHTIDGIRNMQVGYIFVFWFTDRIAFAVKIVI